MMETVKRLIECTGDGYDARAIVGIYDVSTMKPEDLAKQRARHNREFVSASDFDQVVQERDALARRVTEASNAIHAWCHDEDKRDAIEFIVSVLNILDPPVVAGRGGERG